jgi:hypothetical protein
VEVLSIQREEEEKRRAIAAAVELQDEVRKILGRADLSKDLRAWREKRR